MNHALVHDRLLNLLTSSPASYHCATDAPYHHEKKKEACIMREYRFFWCMLYPGVNFSLERNGSIIFYRLEKSINLSSIQFICKELGQ